MSAITRSLLPRAYRPGLYRVFGNSYAEHPTEFNKLYDIATSEKNYEETLETSALGLAPQKPESSGISFDTVRQGGVNRADHISYALGFIVSREAIDDLLYEEVGIKNTKSLARSMRITKEKVAASGYDNATTAGVTYGDGQPLLSVSHPTLAGVQSNLLTGDISEAALEAGAIAIAQMKNNRGLQIAGRVSRLIVPVSSMFEQQRILGSVLRVGTANNDINALAVMGIVPEVHINHYIEDQDSWFLRTDIEGAKLFERTPLEFGQYPDNDTMNVKFYAYERYVPTFDDFRSVFGSVGV